MLINLSSPVLYRFITIPWPTPLALTHNPIVCTNRSVCLRAYPALHSASNRPGSSCVSFRCPFLGRGTLTQYPICPSSRHFFTVPYVPCPMIDSDVLFLSSSISTELWSMNGGVAGCTFLGPIFWLFPCRANTSCACVDGWVSLVIWIRSSSNSTTLPPSTFCVKKCLRLSSRMTIE